MRTPISLLATLSLVLLSVGAAEAQQPTAQSLEIDPALPPHPTGEVVLGGDLVIRLDGKHFLATVQGDDTISYYITSMQAPGDHASRLEIFVGYYVAPLFDPKEVPRNQRRRVKGRLFNKNITWMDWEDPHARPWRNEEVIANPYREPPRWLISGDRVRVSISGPPEDLAELRGIAETLRLQPHS
jgi:hypothetical protein